MVTEYICSFCGSKFDKSKGITYVKKDGTILRFCSSKCRKNKMLNRNPAKLKWTAFYPRSSK